MSDAQKTPRAEANAMTVDEVLDNVNEDTLEYLRAMPRHPRRDYIPAPHSRRLVEAGCVKSARTRGGWHAYVLTEFGEEVQRAMP